MDEKSEETLSLYRLEHAKECLDEAELMLANKRYKGSVTRSYYAVFNAVRSLLALRGVDFKHHSGVISYFRREYIKTGLLDISLSDILKTAYDRRTVSDYSDFVNFTEDDTIQLLASAKDFVSQIESYVHTYTPENELDKKE